MCQRPVYFIFLLLLLSACASKKIQVQQEPPGFLGKIIQNTTARYNAFYNANFIFEESLISGEQSYTEDYTEELPVSIPDALAESGSLSGEMDAVIQKTATVIDKKPYSKWVDDNYLLNGIAHYVKGDYEMAEEIFLYTTSEFKNGVVYERVGARQKVKSINIAKERRKQAREKLKEIEEEKKAKEQEIEDRIKEREERAKRKQKEHKVLSRDEQFKAKQKAKKEGRDLTTEEVLQEIKREQDLLNEQDVKMTEQDVEIISQAPVLEMDNADNPGFLSHPLAAKDAMLWLAKNYITQEKFLAANAVLTAINEDESFPNRLNKDYYLTYADMYIRLENLAKAAEYVQLAIEAAPRREKGRLYYVLGQIYDRNDQPQLARQAYATVEKYHPDYNMIYHAQMRNIRNDYQNGHFSNAQLVADLEKMTRDAKNEEFFGEVYYYLANAYAAQGETDKAIDAYQVSLEENPTKPFSHSLAYASLADHYYSIENYQMAQQNYQSAVEGFEGESLKKDKLALKADALKKIVASYENITLQDSLLELSKMPYDELVRFVENKVGQELKNQVREKLQAANEDFGSEVSAKSTNRRNRSKNNPDSDTFYFYDIQQSVNGFSEFKQIWGDRPNADGWRRKAFVNRNTRGRNVQSETENQSEQTNKQDLINEYLSNVPSDEVQVSEALETIRYEYLNIGEIFIRELGEYEKGEAVLKELVESRKPSAEQLQVAQDLLIIAYRMKGDTRYENQLAKTDEGSKVLERIENSEQTKNSEIDELYTKAYLAFESGNYDEVISIAKVSESFQNNQYEDKFAFISAMSEGYLHGNVTLQKEMSNFVNKYPQSKLKAKAETFIGNQTTQEIEGKSKDGE